MVKMLFSGNLNVRSQNLPPIYHDCGQFYAFKVNSFLESGKLMSGNVLPMIMGNLEVQDIDVVEDWKIAEMKYILMKREVTYGKVEIGAGSSIQRATTIPPQYADRADQ